MREIKKITVLKDGFLLRAQDIEKDSIDRYRLYLLVFNLIDNHNFVRHIAEYTKGKSKGESSKCPGEHLVKIYENDVSAYKNALRKCMEDPKREDDDHSFGERTLFSIYEDINKHDDSRPPRMKYPKIRKKFYFEFFIHKEKGEGKDKKENLRFWLGDYNTTSIEFETEKNVFDEYGAPPPKDKKSEEQQSENELEDSQQSIHLGIDNSPFRFIVKTEDLDYALLKSPRGFNIREAQEDMFRVERKENDELASYLKEDFNILVKGPMKVGKTRLVFEELRKLKSYSVFSLYQSAFLQADELSFPLNFNQENKKIIWFIDDIHYFSSADDKLWSIYEKLVSKFEDVIVIATLRATEEIESRLIKDMETLNVSIWDEGEGDKLANHYGYQKSRFAGTPFSLIKDIKQMKRLYNSKQISLDCRYIFRYLKLLYEFLQFIECDLLKDVYELLRAKSKGTDDFEESLIALESAGFIDRKDNLALSWEPYLENIVTKEDYSQIDSDMEKLVPLFSELRKFQELLNLGIYFLSKNIFKTAIICFEQIIDNGKSKKDKIFISISYKNLGFALSGLKKYEEASEKFEEAIELNPQFNCLQMFLGLNLVKLGKLEEACEKFEETIAINPKGFGTYINWGVTLYKMERFEEASNKFEKATNIDPENSLAYYNWGMALVEMGRVEVACKKFEKSIKLDSGNVQPYYKLGYTFFCAEKFEEACEMYAKVVKIDPKATEAYYKWGRALGELDKYEEACEKFEKTIKLNPENFDAYYNWGNCLSRLERLEEACEKYEKATKIDAEFTYVYFNWGCVLVGLERYEEACEKYEKATNIDPENTFAYINWGSTLVDFLEKYEEACEKFEKATKIDAENTFAHNNWGIALHKLERFKEASEKFEKVTRLEPKNARAYHSWGKALEKVPGNKNNIDKILELYTKAFLLSILQKEWEDARKIGSLKLLNDGAKPEDKASDIYKIVFVFNIALSFILNPRTRSKNEVEDLKYMNEKFRTIESLAIVPNAILKNKKPNIEVDFESEDIILNAAIVLANEIVSKSSLST